jgi:type III secretion protein L
MLVKRTLSFGASTLAEPIIRREHIEENRRAQDVLAHAHAQAEQILLQAEYLAQEQVAQAVAEFWDNATAFIQGLEEQRHALQQEALVAAEHVLGSAMARLLDEAGLAERTRALLRALAASQPMEAIATLQCHPQLLPDVTAWLADSRFASVWQVQASTRLPTDALTLSHATGAFDIQWAHLRAGLLPAGASTEASVTPAGNHSDP